MYVLHEFLLPHRFMEAFQKAHPFFAFEGNVIVGQSGARVVFNPDQDSIVWIPHPTLSRFYSCFAHTISTGSVYLGSYARRRTPRPPGTCHPVPGTDTPNALAVSKGPQ